MLKRKVASYIVNQKLKQQQMAVVSVTVIINCIFWKQGGILETSNNHLIILREKFMKDSSIFLRQLSRANVFFFFLFALMSYNALTIIDFYIEDSLELAVLLANKHLVLFVFSASLFFFDFAYAIYKSKKLLNFGNVLIANFSYELTASQTIEPFPTGEEKQDVPNNIFENEDMSKLIKTQYRLNQARASVFLTRLFPVVFLLTIRFFWSLN